MSPRDQNGRSMPSNRSKSKISHSCTPDDVLPQISTCNDEHLAHDQFSLAYAPFILRLRELPFSPVPEYGRIPNPHQ